MSTQHLTHPGGAIEDLVNQIEEHVSRKPDRRNGPAVQLNGNSEVDPAVDDVDLRGLIGSDVNVADHDGQQLRDFDELLERIRDIRASEKRFYQKVRDVFATAYDYDSSSPTAREFFATVQNKITFAVTGKTAPELIRSRADAEKDNMGLTSWDGRRVRKSDVKTAKNYLTEDEVRELNRLSTMFLDFAQDRAEQRQKMSMSDWAAYTDQFLSFSGRKVLQGAGSVSRKSCDSHADNEFAKYDAARKNAEKIAAENEHLRSIEAAAQEAAANQRT